MSGQWPQVRGGVSRRHNRILRYALAGVGALACMPLVAQELPALRGAVTESRIARELFDRDATSGTGLTSRSTALDDERGLQSTRYQPESEGALPPEPVTNRDVTGDGDTLFPRQDGDTAQETFLAPPPRPAGRPRSATDRLAAERELREAGPETAAERTARSARNLRSGADEELDDRQTGTVRAGRIDAQDPDRNRASDPDSEKAEPIEGLGRLPEEDPFAPLGLRLGTFTVLPTLEQGVTWTSNTYSSQNPQPSVLSETTLRLEAVSDWDRHSASVSGYGTFRKALSGAEYTNLEAGMDGRLRLELGNEYSATATASYQRRPEDASSPVEIAGVANDPLRHTLEGSIGLAKDVGPMRLGVTGRLLRNIYGDAELDTGGTLSQQERNSTLATVALRGGYEISPAIVPFAEVEVGRRFYDVETDSAGYRRSANRFAASAGVELDLRDKLTGELAAGWFNENIDDDRLAAISGLMLRGNLAWSPARGTTVTLNGSTTVEGTNTPGESGSLLYAASLALSRDLRSNLTASATLGTEYRDYVGSNGYDLTLSGQVAMTWWLNRNVGFTGRARHENVTSNLPGRSTRTTSVYAGVTLRR